jgi:hypothetical protein
VQESLAVEDAVLGGKVPRDLFHPGLVWLACDAGDLHTSRLDVDEEEHVEPDQPRQRENLDVEEVRLGDLP